MIRPLLLALGLLVMQTPPAAAETVRLAKAEKKPPKKKKEGKKKEGGAKGGSFTSCDALKTKGDCEAQAKAHTCAWDAIAAGGSCGEGAPM